MADKLNCARSIRNLATLYREMESAAEVLEALGSIEQAQGEAQAKLDMLRAQGSELAAAYKQEVDDFTKLKVAQVQEADQRMNAVNEAIAVKIDAAHKQAADIVQAAKDVADKLMAEASVEQKQVYADLDELTSRKANLTDEVNDLLVQKSEAEKAVATLRATLDDLKSKLGAL